MQLEREPCTRPDREEVALGAEHLVGPSREVADHVLDVMVQHLECGRCRVLEEELEAAHLGPRPSRLRLRPPAEPLVLGTGTAGGGGRRRLPVGGARQGLDQVGTGGPELLGEYLGLRAAVRRGPRCSRGGRLPLRSAEVPLRPQRTYVRPLRARSELGVPVSTERGVFVVGVIQGLVVGLVSFSS